MSRTDRSRVVTKPAPELNLQELVSSGSSQLRKAELLHEKATQAQLASEGALKELAESNRLLAAAIRLVGVKQSSTATSTKELFEVIHRMLPRGTVERLSEWTTQDVQFPGKVIKRSEIADGFAGNTMVYNQLQATSQAGLLERVGHGSYKVSKLGHDFINWWKRHNKPAK